MAKGVSIINTQATVWQSDSGLYTVHLAPGVVDNILFESRHHTPRETGSSLYGEYSPNGHVATVKGLAPVSSDSKRYRFKFLRGITGQKEYFDKLWQESNGSNYYVGEWHSHPKGTSKPSCRDICTQRRISRDRQANCPESILLIIGGNISKSLELAVYIYSRSCGLVHLYPKCKME